MPGATVSVAVIRAAIAAIAVATDSALGHSITGTWCRSAATTSSLHGTQLASSAPATASGTLAIPGPQTSVAKPGRDALRGQGRGDCQGADDQPHPGGVGEEEGDAVEDFGAEPSHHHIEDGAIVRRARPRRSWLRKGDWEPTPNRRRGEAATLRESAPKAGVSPVTGIACV